MQKSSPGSARSMLFPPPYSLFRLLPLQVVWCSFTTVHDSLFVYSRTYGLPPCLASPARLLPFTITTSRHMSCAGERRLLVREQAPFLLSTEHRETEHVGLSTEREQARWIMLLSDIFLQPTENIRRKSASRSVFGHSSKRREAKPRAAKNSTTRHTRKILKRRRRKGFADIRFSFRSQKWISFRVHHPIPLTIAWEKLGEALTRRLNEYKSSDSLLLDLKFNRLRAILCCARRWCRVKAVINNKLFCSLDINDGQASELKAKKIESRRLSLW